MQPEQPETPTGDAAQQARRKRWPVFVAIGFFALIVIALVGYFGRRAHHPRVRGMLQCVVLASATLLVLAAIPIGRDALTTPFTVGGTGSGSDPYVFAKVIRNLFGVKDRLVTGYPGTPELSLAMERGEIDGREVPLLGGVFAIFGHGNVAGLGEALYEAQETLPTLRAHNEQAMALAAIAFAKQHRRRRLMACTSSIGPGATNMVTAAACA